jgi:hypothetical protein
MWLVGSKEYLIGMSICPGSYVIPTKHARATVAKLCHEHGINAKLEGYTNVGTAILTTSLFDFPFYCNPSNIVLSERQEPIFPPENDPVLLSFKALNGNCSDWD